LVFLGANICYWRISFDTDLRAFSCSKPPWSFWPGNDRWRGSVLTNNHESSLIGIEYMYNTILPGASIKIPANSTHWVFTHSAAYNATQDTALAGLLGYEVDGVWTSTPPGGCADEMYPTAKSGITVLARSGFDACEPAIQTGDSYMSIYTAASSAQVFATGSLQWAWGLDDYKHSAVFGTSWPSSVAKQMTYNILRRFSGVTTLTPLP
jgi:hypothetical protein